MSLLNSYTLANGGTSYYALAGSGIPIPGPPGPAGPVGPGGPPGPAGNSILSNVIPPAAGVGQTDDLYVDLVTTQLYKKTDAVTWTPEFSMTGPQGAAATVTVGVTSTIAPGNPANVTNSGTPLAAVLNFAIPQGVQGIQGPVGPPGSAANAALWSKYPATQDVDVGNNQLDNVTAINAPVGMSLTAATGDINLNLNQPGGTGKVIVQGGSLDLTENDLLNVGSVTTAGLANTIDFGAIAAPLANFTVLSSEITMNHLNPITQLLVRGQGDVRVESVAGDLNLIGDDVNIATTGGTNALNITAVGGIQNTAGGFFNVTAGGAMGIQAGALISITTPGSISIGSGNVFGAVTSIEKLNIDDSVVSKVPGAADLEFQNVAKISNAGSGASTLALQAPDAGLSIQGKQTAIATYSNGDILVQPNGTGTTRISTGTTADVVVVGASGVATFASAPQCAAVPTVGADLTNKTYVDTKLPANADVTLGFNMAAPAASPATTGPFLYIPSGAGPPTGVPTVIPGAVPLYYESGSAGIWIYDAGAWVKIP